MLILEFLPAKHGDCILVRWNEKGRESKMVIDGGPDGIYEQVLRTRLMDLIHKSDESPVVDILCITHVDDDHVAGVLALLKELKRAQDDGSEQPIKLLQAWFNSFDSLVDSVQPGLTASIQQLIDNMAPTNAVTASYRQGGDVRNLLTALSLDGNKPFGRPLTVGCAKTINGLNVSVVGPNNDALNSLAKKWREALNNDNANAIAAAFVDRSVPNLSSIALHLTYKERTVLLTGDARGDELIKGMEQMNILRCGGSIHVDVLKLPHHGSKNNVSEEFFKRITADHYVVSADGIKHQHPNLETLEWIVKSRSIDDSYIIHLTNPIPAVQEKLEELSDGHHFKLNVGSPRIEIKLD